MMNVFLIVRAAVVAIIVIASIFLIVSGWAYAKSPRVQMAEELEGDGNIEG